MQKELTGIMIFDYSLTMLTNAFINDVKIHKKTNPQVLTWGPVLPIVLKKSL